MESVNEKPELQPLIQNMIPGLPEIGKIKIGKKGEERQGTNGPWRMPVKLDHFIVTTLERDKTENFVLDSDVMKRIGDNAKKIPVTLLFDTIEGNFQSRFASYAGKSVWCSGDGANAYMKNPDPKLTEKILVKCPCGREQPGYSGKDACKMHGKLSVLIDGVDIVGGVYVYRTTGYNSTVGITSSLALIRTLTGGFLAGLDLDMIVGPKAATDPAGKAVTIQVVKLVYRGSVKSLRTKALEIAQSNSEYKHRLSNVENDITKLISVDADLIDNTGDITDEFHPETATLVQPDAVGAPAVQTPTAAPTAPTTETKPVEESTGLPPAPAPRPRRTKAQMEADRAAQTPAAPVAPAASAPAPVPLTQPDGAQDFDLFE